MRRSPVDINFDFSDIATFVGQGEAFAGVVDSKFYIDEVLRKAHNVAAVDFNRETAAYAIATHAIDHMYEWGTAGINPAPGTPRISPTSKAAMLWRHKLTGGNSASKGIDFEFKPSLLPVPLPTARTAGISGQNIKQWPARRYTFAARPWITEYGVTLHIRPRYATVLFIPLRGEPMTSDPRAIKNNFIMTSHAVSVTPGKQLRGNFQTWWEGWWNKRGYGVMEKDIDLTVNGDMNTVIRATGTRGRAHSYVGGARTKPFTLQVATARAKASAEFKAKVAGRKTEDALMEAQQ